MVTFNVGEFMSNIPVEAGDHERALAEATEMDPIGTIDNILVLQEAGLLGEIDDRDIQRLDGQSLGIIAVAADRQRSRNKWLDQHRASDYGRQVLSEVLGRPIDS